MEAMFELAKLDRALLHDQERPITYLAFQNAEMNRNEKKRKKPFKPEDFYFYADTDNLNLPDPKYGAAALALIRRNQFPSWALFVYQDLKARAGDALPPEVLCFQCEDAILLAPEINGHVAQGLLIASRTASAQVREMVSPCGHKLRARMPEIPGKFEAFENAELRVLG